MGETMKSVTCEFGADRYAALEQEAERLHIPICDVVYRATSAWLNESADNRAIFEAASAELRDQLQS